MSHTEPIFTMAQFRTLVRSKNGSTSRLGDKKNGMDVRVDGWNIGVKVFITYDDELERDVIFVYETGGSNNPDIQSVGMRYEDETYTEEE